MIKENTSGGVYIASRTSGLMPDFGQGLTVGGNSIHTISHGPLYYDIQNASPGLWAYAIGNWWGEYPPLRSEIVGLVNFSQAAQIDPLPGLERRGQGMLRQPIAFELQQNYPNPFNPVTSILYYLPEAGQVDLKVYNVAGQLVKILISGVLQQGQHSVIWDGTNSLGRDVASGIYFYMLSGQSIKASKAMTLLR